MDPYLERDWGPVHARLVTYLADALDDQLPPGLAAVTEQRVALGDTPAGARWPDVAVEERSAANGHAGGTATLLAPITLAVTREPATETFIEIRDAAARLVSVIELLSPANKRDLGLQQLLRKRGEYLAGGVSVMEIDLLRQPNWHRLLDADIAVPPEAETAYRVLYHIPARPDEPGHIGLHPLPLREPLPIVNVPLRHDEPPAKVNLQTVLDQAYRRLRLADRLDYTRSPEPPLEAADAAWADKLLHAAGRR
jgi:hypothetical protein